MGSLKPAVKTLPHIKITCPEGRGFLTTVELDGVPLVGVAFVKFELGPIGFDKHDGIVTLKLYADVEIEGEPEIVKEWRRVERDL